MWPKFKKILLGQALKTEELHNEKFSVFWGLPVLSSDAISSVAYAGEEILWVLIPVIGSMAYEKMFYVALAIIALLFILVFSYRQTINCYPNGGGSFIVAKDNLGPLAALIAASALSIDYILTVAVSISAGTAAIISAFPSLLQHRVFITLVILLILTIGNLRGLKDSSRLFGIPTYLFIVSVIIMIITGIVKIYVFGYTPQVLQEIPKTTRDLTIFLMLKAFAAGCTALTGIEAVSDGIPNFKEPAQKNAKRTLAILSLLVFVIFGGISYLATLYHAVPNPEKTVVSQISYQVFGNSFMFYIIQFTTALILVMAANTAFSDFPLLLSFIAKDGYAPRQFNQRGERLNYANGIKLLSITSGSLIIIFRGETHLLLPLYAIGVFISFTLSQSGMFIRWIKSKQPGWKHKALINGFGALTTFLTAIIIGITKFTSGAWIVCLLIPTLVYIMLRVKSHYNKIAHELSLSVKKPKSKFANSDGIHHVVILVETLNQSSYKAINYAKGLSENIIAFHVSIDSNRTEMLKKKWKEEKIDIPLIIKQSPYRDLITPLVEFLKSEEHASKPGDMITVIMPQFVVKSWWQNILHNQTALFIEKTLLTDRNIAVVKVPYVID